MEAIHNSISQKSKWYKSWHNQDHHKTIHWVMFIAVALSVWAFLYSQISNLVSFHIVNQGVVINLPKAEAIIFLNPQTKTVAVGEIFAAEVILDTGGTPIDGVDIYGLHYDPTILDIIDDEPSERGTQIEPGTIIGFNAANIVDETTGTIKFGQAAAGGTTYTGKGVLATIHFKAIAPGSSYLKFDFTRGSTVDTNAAHKGKDQLSQVVDAIYTVVPK